MNPSDNASRILKPLWHSLWCADLAPTPVHFSRCEDEINSRGIAEYCRLEANLGVTALQKLLQDWNRPEASHRCTHQLGCGNLHTAFAIDRLQLSSELTDQVLELGALSCFILSIYDDLIDESCESQVVTREALINEVLANNHSTAADHKGINSQKNEMTSLIGLYFSRLNELPVLVGRDSVKRTLYKAIFSIYDSESDTVSKSDPKRLMVSVRRKSALIFVVGALPAWLVCEHFTPQQYLSHLRWLYALGDFSGLLDDALDVDDDLRSGHPNFVANWLETKSPEWVSDKIAAYGRKVKDCWDRQSDPTTRNFIISETLSTEIGLAFSAKAKSIKERW